MTTDGGFSPSPCEAEAALVEFFIYLTLTVLFQPRIADPQVSSLVIQC